MKKIISQLPRPLLEVYAQKYLNEGTISEEEFYFLIKKGIKIKPGQIKNNLSLKDNENVLKYCITNKKYNLINDFNEKIFSSKILELLSQRISELDFKNINYFKKLIFLENEQLLLKIIKEEPQYFKNLKPSQVTEEIIKIIENSSYIPDKEDINNNPILLKNDKIMKRSIQKDPNILLMLPKITEDMLEVILREGNIEQIKFTYEDFKKHSILRNDDYFLDIALNQGDYRVIKLYKQEHLTNRRASLAIKNGYIPSAEDFQNNPGLTKNPSLMQFAIKTNPEFIKYLGCRYSFDKRDIVNALQFYQLTENDLQNNPYICKHWDIMELLDESLEKYYANIPIERQVEIVYNLMKDNKYDDIKHLPFLTPKFGSKTLLEDKIKLFEKLNIEIDNKDIKNQEYYYKRLNQIIDGLINIKYIKNKNKFKYSNINILDNEIKNIFEKVKNNQDESLILNLSEEISEFIKSNKILTKDYLQKELLNLYKLYTKNELTKENSKDFYNLILNEHRNTFFSIEKNNMINILLSKSSLSNKKIESLIKREKIRKVTLCLKQHHYEELGMTKYEYQKLINNVRNQISKFKTLKQRGIDIDFHIFEHLETILLKNGELQDFDIESATKTLNLDKRTIKGICKKYNDIARQFINKVSLTSSEIENLLIKEKEKIDFQYRDLIIADEDRYKINLLTFILSLEEEEMQDVLSNSQYFEEIKELILFANYVPDFRIQDLKNIFSNYYHIRKKIFKENDSVIKTNDIYSKISDLISLGEGYSSIDDIKTKVLGLDVCKKVLGYQLNPSKYFNFYLKVLEREKGFIPPINIKKDGYTIESGKYSDTDRLLIGLNVRGSCIDLCNSAGYQTYNECLNEEHGDVLMIKKDGEFVCRSLIVRRGNVIQLAPFFPRGEINLNDELLEEIANNILKSSKENNDNIDYVFFNQSYQSKRFPAVTIPELSENRRIFPHADFEDNAILIGCSRQEEFKHINLRKINYFVHPKSSYLKQREKINLNPNEEDITRLRALQIALEKDENKKNILSLNYEPFYKEDYETVIFGEDWYIAEKKDGTLEEVLLPVKDKRAIIEFSQAKDILLAEIKNSQKESRR